MCPTVCQPTTIRVVRSITVARNSQPSPIFKYVMSPTRCVVATGGVNRRRSRSSRSTASAAGIVVRVLERGWIPAMPSSPLILPTSHNDACSPSAARSVWMRRAPYTRRDRSHSAVIRCARVARRAAGEVVSGGADRAVRQAW